MNYFKAIQNLSRGKTITSVASGRVIRPSEAGQIWVGEHYASHNTLDLTRAEIGGLWSLTEGSD